MTPEKIIAIIGLIIIVITIFVVLFRRMPRRIKSVQYVKKWRDIQRLCSNKDDWSHAIVHADMLLDEVMKKRKISGKTMGERLVQCRDRLSANDAVWNAHKLANKIRQDGDVTLTESEVKEALVAFRQALRDVKAI